LAGSWGVGGWGPMKSNVGGRVVILLSVLKLSCRFE
jgi:hypothetical protein